MDGEKKTLITNIQRMCMHDGPGIRTTVFFKGCSLHCPWCSNPENISAGRESYTVNGNTGMYGKFYTEEELYREIIKDIKFFGQGGGVTFSGGEPLLQLPFLQPLLSRLREKDINICVETALHVPTESLMSVLPYVDLFFVDMKILHGDMCKNVLGGEVATYLHNLDTLLDRGKQPIIRIPCNREYTLKEENFSLILDWLKTHPHLSVEVFATHSLGKAKYESLGKECLRWAQISTEELEEIAVRIGRGGSKVFINSI